MSGRLFTRRRAASQEKNFSTRPSGFGAYSFTAMHPAARETELRGATRSRGLTSSDATFPAVRAGRYEAAVQFGRPASASGYAGASGRGLRNHARIPDPGPAAGGMPCRTLAASACAGRSYAPPARLRQRHRCFRLHGTAAAVRPSAPRFLPGLTWRWLGSPPPRNTAVPRAPATPMRRTNPTRYGMRCGTGGCVRRAWLGIFRLSRRPVSP